MNGGVGPNQPQDKTAKTRRNIILLATILLSLVAVSTAWSAYQATNWGGKSARNYALASAAHTESLKSALTANQFSLLDIQLFIQWVNAWEEGKTELSDFYRTRMRAEALPAFNAWLAQDPQNNPNAPTSPFVMPEYVVQERVKADQFQNRALELARESAAAADVANQYVVTTLFWALTLFFSGMATSVPQVKYEIVFSSMALVLFVFGVVRLITLAVTN